MAVRFGFSLIAFAAGFVATATVAGAPSLAEYIAAICSAAFSSSSPDEAPFLSENASAMRGCWSAWRSSRRVISTTISWR